MPVTESDIFGRDEDITFLNDAWENPDVNVVTIVAWAGVGKSTLINHWLRGMAARHYRSAQLVYGWSFYRQGSSWGTSSADEFLDAALTWFGDPDPRVGTPWEKGERLAKLVTNRQTLLVLDGLEPLQYPPGPQEGRLREPGLQALLRDLAAFNNKGLCVITTRIPVADIADHERTSAPRRDLEQLSSDAGAKLLRALGVKGDEAELRSASDELNGHCLALTLLGSYLSDAYNGDVRCRKEVSSRLTQDVRQGVHARKLMQSYQTWFGEGPELSVLRILGLFDRPVDPRALVALLSLPAIPGVTDSLTRLRPTEWQTIVSRLRRAKLLAGEDPHNPGYLDAHPLVREYFGEQLRTQRTEAWKECNRRLYYYYKTLAPQLPNNLREMEPLFLATICGCHAGLFREALHEVYIPRIQRGNASFAANVLGTRGELLSVLAHFFEQTRLGSRLALGIEGQDLTAEDELFILTQVRLYLTATRGFTAPEVRTCYERAESLCHSINRPLLLYQTLNGHWHYSLLADKLSATLQIAKQLYSSSQELNDAALMIGSHAALATTFCYLGDFEAACQHATRGVQIWRSRDVLSQPEVVVAPIVICLCFGSISGWHLGEFASSRANIEEAISLAKKLNDAHTLASALLHGAMFYHLERIHAKVKSLTSELIELSSRENFGYWLRLGNIYRGWAGSVSGDSGDGALWIEESVRESQRSGVILCVPYVLSIKAEVLYLGGSHDRSASGNRGGRSGRREI